MKIELVFFRVKNQQFGIEIKSINRIIASPTYRKIKKIYFEKTEIPIIDISSYLNLNNHKTDGKKQIIIVELEGIKKGLLVDEVLMMSSLSLDNIKTIPSFIKTTAQKDYFWAIAKCDDELILLLDVRKLYQSVVANHH